MRSVAFGLLAVLGAVTCGRAQDPEPGSAVAKRVFEGGAFEQSKLRRNDGGVLEIDYFADIGRAPGQEDPRWVPLCGEDLPMTIANVGALGLLGLFVHGPADLLAMTDVEFHFGALGVDASDIGLRQYLARRGQTFDGPVGEAELLDRLLAIEHLVRRRCTGARAEMTAIVRGDWPVALQERAARALVQLDGGGDGLERRHVTVDELRIPTTFDACVVIEHARLPSMGWVTGAARRISAHTTAAMLARFGRGVTDAMRNGCQRSVDAVAELPFELVRRYGNARVDHTVMHIAIRRGERQPLALTWQAAGRIETARWREADLTHGLLNNSTIGLQEHAATGAVGEFETSLDPDRAEALLADRGAAVHVVVPAASQLWPLLREHGFPAATGGELRLRFGATPTLELRVDAGDEADAARWVERAKALRDGAATALPLVARPHLADHPAFAQVLAALTAATVAADGRAATATIVLPDVDGPTIGELLSAAIIER